ncbi:hydrogenase isoenzymes formation protein HypC [bacterium BMS3Bbin06]|nr:hydrogenase isoenzymes formation protein HypC [bacterium BMS3Abin08]GBE34312.1 hydrogenase isoenzymes formation protein HypC [bacterium BMS3Bbin06]HDO35032.1 HypC/HybG/HupF family hydrogenase formation chaperone [Nitrospirota bacterium]
MCLAIPSKIIKINNMLATVDVMGAKRDISLMLLPEEAGVGDFVLVHAGFAIQKVREDVAEDSLNFLNEILKEMDKHPEYE